VVVVVLLLIAALLELGRQTPTEKHSK
jgi:hypothetical protein